MQDIAPELLAQIRAEFLRILGDTQLEDLTYAGAEAYADKVGAALAEAFRRCLGPDALPDGKMYWNIADRVLRPLLTENHGLVADATQKVQQAVNRAAGLGLKAQRAPLDESKVDGILQKVAAAEKYENVAWVLDEPVRTFSRGVVDDTLRVNVEFQGRSGLHPKVIRRAEAKCCKWCSNLGGVYEYPNVPPDVYRRHERCRCSVDYDPGNPGGRKTLWAAGDDAQRRALAKTEAKKADARRQRIKQLEDADLDAMSLPQLRKLAQDVAAEYYQDTAAGKTLAKQGTRSSLKKDIRALKEKLKDKQ